MKKLSYNIKTNLLYPVMRHVALLGGDLESYERIMNGG